MFDKELKFEDDEIISIELIPFEGEVFNLSVDEDETYVINNIVSHNCLCFMTSVLMSNQDFMQRADMWMGGGSWPEMASYQTYTGSPSLSDFITPLLFIGLGAVMARWLWGDEDEMDAPFEAQTAALGAVSL